MNLSVFDLFKIGIGPSSSHTVGPMLAAYRFASGIRDRGDLAKVCSVTVDLYGSLALTGRGHATDKAVLLGLSGEKPDTVDADNADAIVDLIHANRALKFAGSARVVFHEKEHLHFHTTTFLPFHPNGLRFTASNCRGETLCQETYYSTGGGFVVKEGELSADAKPTDTPPKYSFTSAKELLKIGAEQKLSIPEILLANERQRRPDAETYAGLDRIWAVMEACIARGCRTGGILPGGLNVERRAAKIHKELSNKLLLSDPLLVLDWVSLFALAVNEENAAGGQVVTAPTNGAAGVIPAVIAYYMRFFPTSNIHGVRRFLLTAAGIGMLYKRNASLSAAEMGCQGEVGVACSMAAAGLAAVMNGSNEQIENAAEIGMEHNLGLTCDPIGGLVQIPCIERNTMGAIKAINAARLAVLHGDGKHTVPLDRVIETMRQTGHDMQGKYKETSQGGLAVNMVDC
ncbi:MAG: L-serine ammonia-lyase [Fimbriiglobus sp.]